MSKNRVALYRVLIKEDGKVEKILEVTTDDIEKYLESYGRTRYIEEYKILSEEVIASKNMLLG